MITEMHKLDDMMQRDIASMNTKPLGFHRSPDFPEPPRPNGSPPTPPPPPLPPQPPMATHPLMTDGQIVVHSGTMHSINNELTMRIEGDNSGAPSRSDIRHNSSGFDGSDTVHALSGLYAQLVVVAASMLVFTEVLHGSVSLLFFHGYVYTYLVGGSIVCLLGVYISMMVDKCSFVTGISEADGPETGTLVSQQPKRSLYSSDISIYLRIGAQVFGLGTLISTGLEVASIFTMKEYCMDELNLAQPILRGLFTFLQMHFLVMNAQEIVYSLGWFRHIALMHIMATNIVLWTRLVMWESAKDWLDAGHVFYSSTERFPGEKVNLTLHTLWDNGGHKVYYTTNCWWRVPEEEKTEDLLYLHQCLKNSTIGAIWEKAMPYMYSFIIQYCLVAAGVVYVIWEGLHSRRKHGRNAVAQGDDKRHSIKVDFLGSSKGLFLGLLVLVSGIIILILFFVLANDDSLQFDTLFAVMALRCSILGVSALGSFLGLIQIRQMQSKTSRRRRLNELLQKIGILAVYTYGISSMIVGGVGITRNQHLVLFLDGTLMVIHACLQSLFIHKISKKRSGPNNEARESRPGRQVVIFLVFANVVLWLIESFTTQGHVTDNLQLNFYGRIPWSLISNIIFPLVIFYRFHSAVALMEAWRKAYKVRKN